MEVNMDKLAELDSHWNEVMELAVRDDDSIKGDFGASLYILTGIPGAYKRVAQHVHPGYIDFEPMFHMGLSAGETVLVALAGNLYNGGFFGGYTPQDIVCYCDTDGVELAARALALRKQRLDINTIYKKNRGKAHSVRGGMKAVVFFEVITF